MYSSPLSYPSDFGNWPEMTGSSGIGDYVTVTSRGELTSHHGDYRSSRRMRFWRLLDEINERFHRATGSAVENRRRIFSSTPASDIYRPTIVWLLACILCSVVATSAIIVAVVCYRRAADSRNIQLHSKVVKQRGVPQVTDDVDD